MRLPLPAPRVPTLLPTAILVTALACLAPRVARAAGGISYKYEDYREADGRIVVTTQSALAQQDFGPDTQLKIQGVIDAIAGATPNGQPAPAGSDQVVLTTLHERRKAWNANLVHQFSSVQMDLGAANSRESDYISDGWSLNAVAGFNQKNTTVTAGVAGTRDKVRVFYQTPWARKRNTDLILGLGQLLDPLTSVTVNVSYGHATGFLNDQYKLVQKRVEVAPGIFLPFTYGENRPDHRTRWGIYAAINRACPGAQGAAEATYRFYHDTFGTDAHTLELAWFQKLGAHLILRPALRYHTQTAANFYHYDLDTTGIVPTGGRPRPAGPFYSSDYRLSSLRTVNYGLKAIWTLSARWEIDASVERYEMHGHDGMTPRSAYPRADVFNAGIKLTW